MRFACQSCGKAYNLPEERIAEKSNVKLKCRVCGAIVEVKKQGELVAHLLDEAEAKRMARVSEAPTPFTSLTPGDEDDPDGATVSISEASINDRGPLELEIPGASPTGFSPAATSALSSASAALSSAALGSAARPASMAEAGAPAAVAAPPALARSEAGLDRLDAPLVAPPPLSPSSLPPPPPLRSPEAKEAVSNGSNGASNGAAVSNGSAVFFNDTNAEVDENLTPELKAPVVPVAPMLAAAASPNVLGAGAISTDLADFPAVAPGAAGETAGKDPMFKIKMLAAFATGVLIDRIVAGLFQ